MSHDTAENYFPDGDAIGKQVVLVASKTTFTFEVIGVLKEQTTGMENGSAFIPRGFYAKKIKPNPAAANVMVQATSQDKYAVYARPDERNYQHNEYYALCHRRNFSAGRRYWNYEHHDCYGNRTQAGNRNPQSPGSKPGRYKTTVSD